MYICSMLTIINNSLTKNRIKIVRKSILSKNHCKVFIIFTNIQIITHIRNLIYLKE